MLLKLLFPCYMKDKALHNQEILQPGKPEVLMFFPVLSDNLQSKLHYSPTKHDAQNYKKNHKLY